MMGDRGTQFRAISFALILVGLSLASTVIAQRNAPDGPGVEWELPQSNMLFLKGDSSSPFLDRNWSVLTGEPLGEAQFQKTLGYQNLINIQSAPLVEAARFEGNITVHLFAALETSNDGCRFTNPVPGSPLGATTTFSVSLTLGGVQVLTNAETESVVMTESFTVAHEFTVRATDVNASLGPGDLVGLKIDVSHDCLQSGVLYWDTYDALTGIEFEGNLLEPELDNAIDSNGMIRIEFTPISPWGGDDYVWQVLEIIGPMDYAQMIHGNAPEDLRLDHFESPHGTRIGDANRTVLTWSADKPLAPGTYMVDACFALSDHNPSEPCDAYAVMRFEVPEPQSALLNGLWAAILIPLAIIGWIGISMRDAMLPLPAYGVILLLAIATLGPALYLPDIEIDSPRTDGAAPSFALLSHGESAEMITLTDLISDSDAIVVGLFSPSSPNAERQRSDFQAALLMMESNIKFLQIATGEGVRAVDLDNLAEAVNESWPILMDEADSSVGKAFPSGASDAVIIIDSAGFISEWRPGTMSAQEILDAADNAAKGSGNNPIKLLSLITTTAFLPLIILSMPRERKFEIPTEPLIPGSGSALTIAASGLGFAFWALPISLLAALGLGAYWIWIEVILSIILIYHGVSMLTRGSLKEIEIIGEWAYGKIPENYQNWRSKSSFIDDVHLGLWVAWLVWLRIPNLIPQGVGSLARSGLVGIPLSLIMLAGFVFVAGLLVVFSRIIVLLPGKLSRLLGSVSVGLRPRAWGLASCILGAWILISLILGPIQGSM
jgi:hypothetical protein